MNVFDLWIATFTMGMVAATWWMIHFTSRAGRRYTQYGAIFMTSCFILYLVNTIILTIIGVAK